MIGTVIRGIFIVVIAGYFLSLGATYFSYIEPYLFPLRMIQGEARFIAENIIIGPYPHEKDIEKLVKINNVSVIISLLNPALPFEESLIKKEKEIAEKYGIKFYNTPVNFINLESKENYLSVARIRRILKQHKDEVIYIHCYLGRHRVEFVAKNIIGVRE